MIGRWEGINLAPSSRDILTFLGWFVDTKSISANSKALFDGVCMQSQSQSGVRLGQEYGRFSNTNEQGGHIFLVKTISLCHLHCVPTTQQLLSPKHPCGFTSWHFYTPHESSYLESYVSMVFSTQLMHFQLWGEDQLECVHILSGMKIREEGAWRKGKAYRALGKMPWGALAWMNSRTKGRWNLSLNTHQRQKTGSWELGTHTCNLSYMKDWDWEDHG
jgi:hypothetical protein